MADRSAAHPSNTAESRSSSSTAGSRDATPNTRWLQIATRAPQSVGSGVRVGPPDDPAEREADTIADRIIHAPALTNVPPLAHRLPPLVQRLCRACEQDDEPFVQRQADHESDSLPPEPGLADRLRRLGPGQPFGPREREYFEPRMGGDLSSLRIHTRPSEADLARQLHARAFTHGGDLVFAAGEYRPETASGRHLIAHELVHAAQQGALGSRTSTGSAPTRGLVQRVGEATRGGPCAIEVGTLTNDELLGQLNRARVYLATHARGEGEYYDYANLLRRASGERRTRAQAGHVWLTEPGLLHPPDVLYGLDGAAASSLRVTQIAGSLVAGPPQPVPHRIVVTLAQFERVLARENIPVVDLRQMMAERSDPTAPLTMPMTPRERTVTSSPNAFDPNNPFGFSGGDPFRNPLGLPSFDPLERMGVPSYDPFSTAMRTRRYTPSVDEALGDVARSPGSVASGGPERVFVPSGGSGAGARGPSPTLPDRAFVLGDPNDLFNPVMHGVGAGLSPFAMPSFVPNNTSGVLWSGGHTSDMVVVDGRPMFGGFRSSMARHGLSDAERALNSRGGPATRSLNRGTPGSYANDALFPLFGDAVLVYRADGSALDVNEVGRLMGDARRAMEGAEYRYSPPPPGSAAHRDAFGDRGPNFCPPGTSSCVNVPMNVHDEALGGHHMVIPREDGTIVDLGAAEHATARNMREWSELPDSFFTERGLVRTRLAGPSRRAVGVSAGMSGVISLGTDIYSHATTGDRPAYLSHAAVNVLGGAASTTGEIYLSNQIALSLTSRGVAATTSIPLGRFVGGTGVAVVAAPLVTMASMAFDDADYTRIDYAAAAGRSSTTALGGALASGLFFAAAGSELPVAGNIVGFVIGFGGALVTDWLVGDTVEETIRIGLGELGCTDGVGAGH
ncbi:DUF4157 domain-containing protein [Nannocystaceae bacterium ST9]